MQRYILDTNLFFNMEEGMGLGDKTEEVVRTMTASMQATAESKTAEFYMPPRIVEEFLSFFEDPRQPFLTEFLSHAIIRSPHVGSLALPAQLFYDLIEDVRGRSYRGLRVGEEEIQKAGQLMMGKETLPAKEFQMSMGAVIKPFRDRYRQATRVGFLDSLGDLDVIMLAKELDAYVVTTDAGVVAWGRKFGIKEMPVSSFGVRVREFLKAPHHQA